MLVLSPHLLLRVDYNSLKPCLSKRKQEHTYCTDSTGPQRHALHTAFYSCFCLPFIVPASLPFIVPAVRCASKPAVHCASRSLCQPFIVPASLPFIVPAVRCACRLLCQQACHSMCLPFFVPASLPFIVPAVHCAYRSLCLPFIEPASLTKRPLLSRACYLLVQSWPPGTANWEA